MQELQDFRWLLDNLEAKDPNMRAQLGSQIRAPLFPHQVADSTSSFLPFFP